MLLRLPSTNFKLICGKLVSNPTEIINVMIECPLCHLL